MKFFKKKKMAKRLRNFCWTLNNYTEENISDIKTFADELCSYMVVGKEVGDSGTPHLQGYAELKKQTMWTKLKSLLPRGTHIEKRKGTAKQAADYCKKDGDFKEIGTMKHPGKRNDLDALHADVKKGHSLATLYENHFGPMLRYHKGVEKYMALNNKKEFQEVKVYVLWGVAGSGKTRAAYERFPDLYKLPKPTSNGSAVWFDGYSGERELLIDDFYGGIKYSYLLELLDGYPMLLPVKGSHVSKNWDTVVITSNSHPRDWYKTLGYPLALQRRILEITHFDDIDEEDVRKPIENKISTK